MNTTITINAIKNAIVAAIYNGQIDELVDFIDEINQQYDADILRDINIALSEPQILSVLIGVIRNNKANYQKLLKESYYHENGFHKIVLLSGKTFKIRLHHFGITAKAAMENIHDHRWTFSSSILYGKLDMDLFEVSAKPKGAETLYHFVYNSNKESGSYDVERQGLVFLNKIATSSFVAGDCYLMYPSDLHRIVNKQGQESITMIITGKPHSSECNLYAKRPIRDEEKSVVNYSAEQMENMLDIILEKIYPQKN